MQKYTLSPNWTLEQQATALIISGGADARYEVTLDSDGPSFFANLEPGTLFDRTDLTISDQRALEQLITAEIIVPNLPKSVRMKVKLIGDAQRLAFPSNARYTVVTGNNYDIGVILRTNQTLAQLLEQVDYQSITKPHLFIDNAFHHTLSIGPLVFPGETACIACLQGRLTTRWGDQLPPAAPQLSEKYGSLATALVASELDRINDGDTSLVNRTVAWNLQDRVTKRNQLLKVPLCPICSQNTVDHSGVLALPWRKDESISNTV